MATTNQPFPFPHPVLTRIIGEPDADSVEQLKSEVYANVQSISSPFGGGIHGHLGAVTDAITYQRLSGQNVPYNKPVQPPLPAVNIGHLTQPQLIERNRIYQHKHQLWQSYSNLVPPSRLKS